MNVVKEIARINQAELDLGISGASWHDEFKDSAYIFVGGLNFDLTEGDVIAIFSQYGEVLDLNMPRHKDTGARKGFAFLMYEDQRSTVLAVDNLNGAKVLERTLRVDHAKGYKQQKIKNEDGELVDPEEQSMNAKPELINDEGAESESSASTGASIDLDDPMRDYLIAQRREKKALKKEKKAKGKGRHKDETPEERRERKARKAQRKARKAKSAVKGVEELLNNLGKRDVDFEASSYPRSSRHSPERRRRSMSPPGHSSRGCPPYGDGHSQRDHDRHHSRARTYRDSNS